MPIPNDDDNLELQRLLRCAAQLATAHSVESEQFLVAACQAFLACNPALRAKLEEEREVLDMAAARGRGKVAQA
ncbi:MAG TPA: hypothetical protein VMZ53_07815 [Kofleriaceae bacterium]|nr:hypothetical protein [Kofleriaceae bacterium]